MQFLFLIFARDSDALVICKIEATDVLKCHFNYLSKVLVVSEYEPYFSIFGMNIILIVYI